MFSIKNKKWAAVLIADIIIIGGLILYFGVLRHKPEEISIKIAGVYLPTAVSLPDFHLIDDQGRSFTKENLTGHWTMMFFGFTHCGYVCPTTLAELNAMYLQLEKELPRHLLPQIVFISVDPERDTPAKIHHYVTAFNSHFTGARGDSATTAELEEQLHIAAKKIRMANQDSSDYRINHTADILLINPEGRLQAWLGYPHQAKIMVGDYKRILAVAKQI